MAEAKLQFDEMAFASQLDWSTVTFGNMPKALHGGVRWETPPNLVDFDVFG